MPFLFAYKLRLKCLLFLNEFNIAEFNKQYLQKSIKGINLTKDKYKILNTKRNVTMKMCQTLQ